uniref:Transmembrane protein 198 n=1 Tax=Callorhinchus milii TaxID=7868 RepID=A0A4W3J4T6_CALMI
MLVRSVGLFMVGLLLGLLIAVATLVVMEQFYHPRTVWVPIGLLLGTGMLFAVLTLQWQKFFTVLSTAAFGSAIMTVTADYFIELSPGERETDCDALSLCLSLCFSLAHFLGGSSDYQPTAEESPADENPTEGGEEEEEKETSPSVPGAGVPEKA